MRRCAQIRITLWLTAALAAAHGEIIDRIAASVGNRVITASDLDRQIRVVSFQDGVKADFSAARKKATVEAMIEQKLVESELANSRYPMPNPADLAPAIADFKKEYFKDDAEYRASLESYGIREEDFKELLLWQRTINLFIQVRFETGVQLTAAEVEDFFAKTVKAEHPGQPVRLEDYRDQIEKSLTAQKADKEMDTWLRDVRRRTNIVVHEEVLR